MGVVFQVAVPELVFEQPAAARWRREFGSRFGLRLPDGDSDTDVYYSDELGMSWFGQLQERVLSVLGKGAAPNLLVCDSWATVYLSVLCVPQVIDGPAGMLACGSLSALRNELRVLGRALGWPIDRGSAELAAARYMEEAHFEDDPEKQVYLQLWLAADTAANRSLPLWIVK